MILVSNLLVARWGSSSTRTVVEEYGLQITNLEEKSIKFEVEYHVTDYRLFGGAEPPKERKNCSTSR